MHKYLIALIGCTALGCMSAAIGAAPNGSVQIATAADHAQMAAAAANVETVHMHLHHVVNCLVGPNGSGFDAAAGDPCKGMGDGALSEVSKTGPEYGKLEQILQEAKQGLAENDYGAAQKAAKQIAADLVALKKI